jgi:hypothetical protein
MSGTFIPILLTRKRCLRWLFLILIFKLTLANLQALVVDNTSLNTTAPSDGSPWNNVGTVNGATGVYLGNGWVLTAGHVGAGSITLGGASFNYDGLSNRLTNPYDNTASDLLLFHLFTMPGLPTLTLSSSTPLNASLVDMIGYGFNRGSTQKNYPGGFTGFDWSTTAAKSWGTNRINLPLIITTDFGNGTVAAFTTDFTQSGHSKTAYETQAAGGDSGGGVFYFNGSSWELAGIMDEVSEFDGQLLSTAVYGNQTLSADIATYRYQIESIIAIPEPGAFAMFVIGLLLLAPAVSLKTLATRWL